jgi:hypothetical protein
MIGYGRLRPGEIDLGYYSVMYNMNCTWPNHHNYNNIRNLFLQHFLFKLKKKKKKKIDFDTQMIIHFSYCKGMEKFAPIFHEQSNEFFGSLAISNMKPMVDFRNCYSLQRKLVKKTPESFFLTISSSNS